MGNRAMALLFIHYLSKFIYTKNFDDLKDSTRCLNSI